MIGFWRMSALEDRLPASGWRSLAGGAWLYSGKQFCDTRGESLETFDFSDPDLPFRFDALQENLVHTRLLGCARGLHYQVGSDAQAKLVTVLRGVAQFFWVPLHESTSPAIVNSVVLPTDGTSLLTTADCAHGFLALEDETTFLLRMSAPISIVDRREINILSPELALAPALPIAPQMLSDRDRCAPSWSERRLA